MWITRIKPTFDVRSLATGAVLAATAALTVGLGSASALPTKPVGTFNRPNEGNPTGVAVAGRYAYLAHACGEGCYGPLDVIDVSKPKAPTLVGSTPLSWGTSGIVVQGSFAYTTGFLANPNYLRMIDVSKPTAPFSAAAFTIAGLHPVAVAVQDGRAYMLDYGTNQLEAIDVSDPKAGAFSDVQNTAPFSLPLLGALTTDAGPSGIAVAGRFAYVVNAVSGSVQTVDLSDPTHLAVTGRVDLGAPGVADGSLSAVAVDGTYA